MMADAITVQSLTKPQYYMDEVRRIFPRAKAGNDGMTAELMFED